MFSTSSLHLFTPKCLLNPSSIENTSETSDNWASFPFQYAAGPTCRTVDVNRSICAPSSSSSSSSSAIESGPTCYLPIDVSVKWGPRLGRHRTMRSPEPTRATRSARHHPQQSMASGVLCSHTTHSRAPRADLSIDSTRPHVSRRRATRSV